MKMTIAAIAAAIAVPGTHAARRTGGTVATPRPCAAPGAMQAAVALVLAGRDGELSLCFIRRASHPRDPWSGQMALPGGRAAPADASLCAAAMRETHEEVGLSLSEARCLGALPPIPLVRQGRRLGGSVAPFVFVLGTGSALPELRVDPAEVAAGYWIALRHLCDPEQRAELHITGGGVTRRLPAVRFRRHLIWGMTYRIVTGLLDRATAGQRPDAS